LPLWLLCPAASAPGAEGMSFLFTWLRMSSNKILTWARRANYQSKVCVNTVIVLRIHQAQYQSKARKQSK
jgi:hypothetical protein